MSNLSKRVQKAKELGFSHSPYRPNHYATRGSKDKDYGLKYYRITLNYSSEVFTIKNPDYEKEIKMVVLLADCQKDNGKEVCDCPGNSRHTVCYHSLGAIYQAFKADGKLVSFFEAYDSAQRMSFGGKIAKVKSANGGGHLWAIVKGWPKPTLEERVTLIRGKEEEQDGID